MKKLRSESATSQEGLKKGTWSEDEHERLVLAIAEYGTDGNAAWANIQQYVGTRDIKQCKDRYKLKLDESFTSSEWTKQEDQILTNCVETYGQRWTKIAQELPGRNENSIKTRYHTLQRRELKVWTPEEENLLKNLLARQVSFEDICQCFPRKTPNMIASRRDYLAMEVTAESIKQQIRATSPDDINSALRKSCRFNISNTNSHTHSSTIHNNARRTRHIAAAAAECCTLSTPTVPRRTPPPTTTIHAVSTCCCGGGPTSSST